MGREKAKKLKTLSLTGPLEEDPEDSTYQHAFLDLKSLGKHESDRLNDHWTNTIVSTKSTVSPLNMCEATRKPGWATEYGLLPRESTRSLIQTSSGALDHKPFSERKSSFVT
ncbi:hypothetical protein J6590_051095 [Homalodisca vitripennis]|nr:hypothetical protein J6590_051095 [Homalodisca vitripennis]